MSTTVLSSVFDTSFKAYMTYNTSSTNTTYSVSVSAAGVYQSCSYSQYSWSTTVSATGHSASGGNVGVTYWNKGYHSLTSKSCSWTRTTSAYTVTVTVTSKQVSSGKSGSKSVNFTVPALASYSVKYDANGGNGAPSGQTKYYGKTLTLSNITPTRTGYTFKGWSTSSTSTSIAYAAGASYTGNAALTLYAVWKANTYVITLNANGGTNGSVTSITKTYDHSVTLPTVAQSPTKTYYKFLGWSTSSNASTATWEAGDSYTTNITSNTTLYAVWKEDYIPPAIKVFAIRTNSSGVEDNEGGYAVATFSWTNGTMSGVSVTPNSITVQCRAQGESSWAEVYSKTSSFSSPITTNAFKNGSVLLNTESQYDIKVTVTDAYSSVSNSTFISKSKFIMDINAEGNGVSIGEAAEDIEEDLFNVAWDSKFKKKVEIIGDATLGNLNVNGNLMMEVDEEFQTLWTSVFGSSGGAVRLLDFIFHKGYIITTKNADFDPNTFMPWQTWTRYAKGRTLVGVNEDDTDFATAGKTGGEKTHKLTVSEMPKHRHSPMQPNYDSGTNYGWHASATAQNNGAINYNAYEATSYSGGDASHNNLQPYITVYMWVRTA